MEDHYFADCHAAGALTLAFTAGELSIFIQGGQQRPSYAPWALQL